MHPTTQISKFVFTLHMHVLVLVYRQYITVYEPYIQYLYLSLYTEHTVEMQYRYFLHTSIYNTCTSTI